MLSPLLSFSVPPAGWSAGSDVDAVFSHSYEQIAREERRLRELAETQLRAYQQLVQDLAVCYAAQALDEAKRCNPQSIEHATPGTWRQFFEHAHAPATAGWLRSAPTDQGGELWRAEAERLRARAHELETTLTLLQATLGAHAASPQPAAFAPAPAGSPAPLAPGAESQPQPGPTPGAGSQGAPPGVLPAMPAQPPSRFELRIENWSRVASALAALATTGFAMRQELFEILAHEFGVGPRAGSLPKLFAALAEHGLVAEEKLVLRGVHKPKAGVSSDTTLILLRLTPKGSDLARACGLCPVESEWERLIQRHAGADQPAHTALVCTFTYHARRRGCTTQVCPAVAAPAQPDVLLTWAGAPLYVAVEGESGTPERRMTTWQNQVALQGKVALCAPNPEIRATLVNAAQAAGAEHGLATDLQSLFDTQAERGPLWAYEW